MPTEPAPTTVTLHWEPLSSALMLAMSCSLTVGIVRPDGENATAAESNALNQPLSQWAVPTTWVPLLGLQNAGPSVEGSQGKESLARECGFSKAQRLAMGQGTHRLTSPSPTPTDAHKCCDCCHSEAGNTTHCHYGNKSRDIRKLHQQQLRCEAG
jgi:hypothetical protein